MDKPTIFIAHGHDSTAREQLELLLRKLDLTPFVLQDNPGGMTIIEELENHIYTGIDFGIVLLTPDDEGYKANEPNRKRYRARQNVILEMGMLFAAIRRKNVALLIKGNVEIPSDIEGIHYHGFKEHIDEIAVDLCRHMKQSGIPIDFNKL